MNSLLSNIVEKIQWEKVAKYQKFSENFINTWNAEKSNWSKIRDAEKLYWYKMFSIKPKPEKKAVKKQVDVKKELLLEMKIGKEKMMFEHKSSNIRRERSMKNPKMMKRKSAKPRINW